jgi:hypothetical protein
VDLSMIPAPAVKSRRNRRLTAALTVLSIAPAGVLSAGAAYGHPGGRRAPGNPGHRGRGREEALLAVSALMVVVGLAGGPGSADQLERAPPGNGQRRGLAGARPAQVFALILGEAAFLTLSGVAPAIAAPHPGLPAGRPWLESRIGVSWPTAHELGLTPLVGPAEALIGLLPAGRIYRYSLAGGMTARI